MAGCPEPDIDTCFHLMPSLVRWLRTAAVLTVLSTCWMWMVHADVTWYIAVSNEKITNSYKTMTNSTDIRCGVYCASDETCHAFNHQKTTQTCELVDNSIDYNNFSSIFITGWKAYYDKLGTVYGQTGCPSGWIIHGESCYLLHTHDQYDWAESKGFCDSLNAHLAFIEDEEENTFVKGIIKEKLQDISLSVIENRNVWLGATDKIEEAKFMWYSFHGNDEQPVTHTGWHKDEPTHNNNILGSDEDCMTAIADIGWQWADIDCNAEAYYICEKEAVGFLT